MNVLVTDSIDPSCGKLLEANGFTVVRIDGPVDADLAEVSTVQGVLSADLLFMQES